MPKLPMPGVLPGNLRTLMQELHDLHARAGWPSTRQMAQKDKFSHAAVHALFTKTTSRVPRVTVLLDVVEWLATQARRIDVENTVDKFDELWRIAEANPFDELADGKAGAKAPDELSAEAADTDVADASIAARWDQPEESHPHPVSVRAQPSEGEQKADANRKSGISLPDLPLFGRGAEQGVRKSRDAGGYSHLPKRNTTDLGVLAVDSDRSALEELAYLLSEDSRVGTVYKASAAIDALRILNSRQGWREAAGMPEGADIDLVFLEIRMPDLDGLELAKVFKSMTRPPSVVFVTDQDDRAVDAFVVGAVDYLLKPIRSDQLAASIDRVLTNRAHRLDQSEDDDEVLPIELAGSTKFVHRSAVLYVEAQGDHSRLYTQTGTHIVRISMPVLEDRWRDAGFLRIHRSFLVSLPLVKGLRLSGAGFVVQVGSGPDLTELPVSRRYSQELQDRLHRAAANVTREQH